MVLPFLLISEYEVCTYYDCKVVKFAYFKELTYCDYFPIDCDGLLVVGWLSKNHDFNKGKVDAGFFEKLEELLMNPWQPVVSAGFHECELCQFDPACFSSNIFIPFNGKIYVAPGGIKHYIAQHWYLPPQIFIDAVMECPEMNSMNYKKKLLANGGRALVKMG